MAPCEAGYCRRGVAVGFLTIISDVASFLMCIILDLDHGARGEHPIRLIEMLSRDFIFWEVDVQRDFMLPGGKLYVPGAEKLVPNIERLTDAARRDNVLLVSSGDFHAANDPEFKQFPPHCVKGTTGAELLPEALAEKVVRVENMEGARIPEDISSYQQVVLEKQTLDVFETLHADELVERLGSGAEFVVFGVATEYCVACAVKGLLRRNRRVAVVRDAIEGLTPEAGARTLAEFEQMGARLVTTDEALAGVSEHPTRPW